MLRRNITGAECQISDSKGRYSVFTLLFFQMPIMKTQDLNTKIITKKPKSARNCESRVRFGWQPTIGAPNWGTHKNLGQRDLAACSKHEAVTPIRNLVDAV